MQPNETSGQEPRDRTDLEVTVLPNGVVNVHRPESDRAHSVFVDADGGVLRCSCRGWKYNGECSHADEIASRPIVTASASAAASPTPEVATDGGREQPTRSEHADFGGGSASGMDDLGDPAETVDDGETDEDGDTDTEADDEPGTVDVHGCSTCSGFAEGGDDQCAECQQRGVEPIGEEVPL